MLDRQRERERERETYVGKVFSERKREESRKQRTTKTARRQGATTRPSESERARSASSECDRCLKYVLKSVLFRFKSSAR